MPQLLDRLNAVMHRTQNRESNRRRGMPEFSRYVSLAPGLRGKDFSSSLAISGVSQAIQDMHGRWIRLRLVMGTPGFQDFSRPAHYGEIP